jgi:uncharacterized protein
MAEVIDGPAGWLSRLTDRRLYTPNMGRTALMQAASENHVQAVRLLLQYGANPNARDREFYNWDALMAAAYRGSVASARILLEHGADVNSHNDVGETPLSIAMKTNQTAMVNILKSAGGKP